MMLDPEKIAKQLLISSDSSTLAALFDDRSLQLWNLSTLHNYATIELPSTNNSAAFNPVNNLLVTGSARDKSIRFWDIHTGNLIQEIQSPTGTIEALAFSPDGKFLATLDDGVAVYIWGFKPGMDTGLSKDNSNSEGDKTAIATRTRVPTPTRTATPTNPPPTPWPINMPDGSQIEEARKCKVEQIASTRYPDYLSGDDLKSAYPAESACDWAILASAYQSHNSDDTHLSEEGIDAFSQSIGENPAFIFTALNFYVYFNSLELVEPPPFASQPVKQIKIKYEWSGIGEPNQVAYQITINNADRPADQISLNVQAKPEENKNTLTIPEDSGVFQDLGKALGDLVPMRSPVFLEVCTDNSSDWQVDLTYADGRTMKMFTHQSNVITAGGPWQVNIDDTTYLQYSTDFLVAILNLFNALNLPLGEPYGMYCSPIDVFDQAFPK